MDGITRWLWPLLLLPLFIWFGFAALAANMGAWWVVSFATAFMLIIWFALRAVTWSTCRCPSCGHHDLVQMTEKRIPGSEFLRNEPNDDYSDDVARFYARFRVRYRCRHCGFELAQVEEGLA